MDGSGQDFLNRDDDTQTLLTSFFVVEDFVGVIIAWDSFAESCRRVCQPHEEQLELFIRIQTLKDLGLGLSLLEGEFARDGQDWRTNTTCCDMVAAYLMRRVLSSRLWSASSFWYLFLIFPLCISSSWIRPQHWFWRLGFCWKNLIL
jgi:hypothetical protein